MGVNTEAKSFRMIAQRYDNRIQDCMGDSLKMSFPDFDYALFGYNILFGYPFAQGHDPGLTHPIFHADYSEHKQTADCRYNKPRGYTLVPDVSCVTSFTSKVVQQAQQFSRSLSVSAEASGGGWGVSFSASASYKQTVSEMSSSESVFIFSEAKCNYYFAMLDENRPPPLDPSFIEYVKNKVKTKGDVFRMFDYYGTHFLKYVLFGAKLVYRHKMSKSSFKKESSSDTDVSVKASYSGLFSVGGGFGMSSKQKQAAESFQEDVETTTISIGAPPPESGGTAKWASTVKETPVPVEYKLESIERLFTVDYMKDTGIDYQRLYPLVEGGKRRYCVDYLYKSGTVDSCKPSSNAYVTFDDTNLALTYFKKLKGSQEICIQSCLDNNRCFACVYFPNNNCQLYSNLGNKSHTVKAQAKTKTIVFTDSMKILDKDMRFANSKLKEELQRSALNTSDESGCAQHCRNDKVCAAYTFGGGLKAEKNCQLFQQNKIFDNSLVVEDGSVTVFNP